MFFLFLAIWVAALLLWISGLLPFIRLKRYLVKQKRAGLSAAGVSDLAQVKTILKDKQHPMHTSTRRVMFAYGGFLFFWIVGFALSALVFPRH